MKISEVLDPDKKYEKNFPKLNNDSASQILVNIFSASDRTPNTIPLDVLASYAKYRRDRYALQKRIVVFFLIAFMLLPLCFVAPRYSIEETSRARTGVPTYEVKILNHIPVRLVSAKINNTPLVVYESEASVYSVEPKTNGIMTITVTLFNKQYDIITVPVSGIDTEAPVLVNSKYIDGNIRIYLSDGDDGVGVDFANAYGISSVDTSYIDPSSYNAEEGYVEFPYRESMNIFIPDLNGNILHLILTCE